MINNTATTDVLVSSANGEEAIDLVNCDKKFDTEQQVKQNVAKVYDLCQKVSNTRLSID